MTGVADLTLDALSEAGHQDLEGYGRVLRHACAESPPPFGRAWYGDKFRSLASEEEWLAHSLVLNAAKEGEGSEAIFEMATQVGHAAIARQIHEHAVDESRHSLVYIAMLETAFPGAVPVGEKPSLTALSPQYRLRDGFPSNGTMSEDQLLDGLVQMNLGEIRTRIHQLLMTPVILAHCPRDRRPKLVKMLSSIVRDETKHIAYTARLIEAAIRRDRGPFIERVAAFRLEEFNRMTLQQVGAEVYEGS